MRKSDYIKLAKDVAVMSLVTALIWVVGTEDAWATVISSVRARAVEVIEHYKPVVYIMGGFGLIGVAWGAIFGKMNWKWFANLSIGLFLVAWMGSVIDYFTVKSGAAGHVANQFSTTAMKDNFATAYGDSIDKGPDSVTADTAGLIAKSQLKGEKDASWDDSLMSSEELRETEERAMKAACEEQKKACESKGEGSDECSQFNNGCKDFLENIAQKEDALAEKDERMKEVMKEICEKQQSECDTAGLGSAECSEFKHSGCEQFLKDGKTEGVALWCKSLKGGCSNKGLSKEEREKACSEYQENDCYTVISIYDADMSADEGIRKSEEEEAAEAQAEECREYEKRCREYDDEQACKLFETMECAATGGKKKIWDGMGGTVCEPTPDDAFGWEACFDKLKGKWDKICSKTSKPEDTAECIQIGESVISTACVAEDSNASLAKKCNKFREKIGKAVDEAQDQSEDEVKAAKKEAKSAAKDAANAAKKAAKAKTNGEKYYQKGKKYNVCKDKKEEDAGLKGIADVVKAAEDASAAAQKASEEVQKLESKQENRGKAKDLADKAKKGKSDAEKAQKDAEAIEGKAKRFAEKCDDDQDAADDAADAQAELCKLKQKCDGWQEECKTKPSACNDWKKKCQGQNFSGC